MTDMSFWSGKKVFVTGHTGFKGAWLTAMLTAAGAKVAGYALPAREPGLFPLLKLKNKITHIEADIRDAARVRAEIEKADPDIILHLAAQALVRESYNDPVTTMETNVNGTINVLEAARGREACRAVVIVTSDKCYLNDESGRFFNEGDQLGGKDPYSASKAAAEIATQCYYESFFKASPTAVATARAGNVIGGGDWARDRLIPDVYRAYLAEQPVQIRQPQSTRPWQHVLEPLRGYLLLAERLYKDGHAYAGGWNFGPERQDIRTVESVLTALQKTLPFDLQIDNSAHPAEAKTLGLDITKARRDLGWTPQMSLDQALEWTGGWYKAAADGADMERLTLYQINEYLAGHNGNAGKRGTIAAA